MNTRHCHTCHYWDTAQRLERTNFGDLAPCTRSAPSHYSVASVLLRWSSQEVRQPNRGNLAAETAGELQIPIAIWPYTAANQACGDYLPCDLEENARRNKLRAAPVA
jgi:hypothetical protein